MYRYMELVVFAASLKFFFIEGGEQFIVGIQTAKKIGSRSTLKITAVGMSFAVILFFLLFYSRTLVPTRWLEFALAITLYFFAARMLKEVIKKEEEEEFEEKAYKYGYAALVGLESVENATALAALTFVNITGALAGAAISISVFAMIVIGGKRLLSKIPLQKLKLVSGVLLALTATPLLVYSLGVSAPSWFYWIIPPLR
jgi:uncharacterized membrane protein